MFNNVSSHLGRFQQLPLTPHAGASACGLLPEDRIAVTLSGGCELRTHLCQAHLQLLGNQRGQGRGYPLPHLGMIDDHGDHAPLAEGQQAE